MTKLTLLDKLGVLINISHQSIYFIILLLVLALIGFGLSFINLKNEKKYKIIYISTIIAILLFVVILYHSSIGKMISYMMDNFFIAIYFPTLAIYMAALIAMNIIIWVSILSYKSSKLIRNLNIVVYVIMNYLLALLLHVIVNNKLDVYSQSSIYENTDARALIELSSSIFIIWIIFLILYKLILIYVIKDYKTNIKKVTVTKKILPENYIPINMPDVVYGIAPHRETIVINKVKEEKHIDQDKFTLEEYKVVSDVLKKQVEKNTKKVEEKETKKEKKEKYKAIDNKTIGELYGTIKDIDIDDIAKADGLSEIANKKIKEEFIIVEDEPEVSNKEQIRLNIEDEDDDIGEEKLTELEMLYRSIR